MQTLLLVGCGDIAQRAAPWLTRRFRVLALIRDPAQITFWRKLGCKPIMGDLDDPRSLLRLRGLADRVLHLAPPSPTGEKDLRTQSLLQALGTQASMRGRSLPARFVYVSTTGVYGDCEGAEIDETRPTAPSTLRAKRRVQAEQQILQWGKQNDCPVIILRAPGIYAQDRLPLERIRNQTPALAPEEDVFSNHIHADDLAMACCRALFQGKPHQAINIVDDSALKMGDYFDAVADANHLPRPPRLARKHLETCLSPVQLSFMSESRRIRNDRMKKELGLVLRYPTVADALQLTEPLNSP